MSILDIGTGRIADTVDYIFLGGEDFASHVQRYSLQSKNPLIRGAFPVSLPHQYVITMQFIEIHRYVRPPIDAQ